MATVRAKFFVTSVANHSWAPGEKPKLTTVTLNPVPYDHKNPESENSKFWKASPNGKLEMTIENAAAEQFEVGKEYYIDFIPVAPPAA